jgi:hypothetical protein
MGTAEHHKGRSVISSSDGDETVEQKYKTPVEFHRKSARFVGKNDTNMSISQNPFVSSG